MMKSFFKKLAFVMALAMVVSLAAPAGSAMAAEALRVVTQETNEVVTEWNIAKVGETQDFKFWDYKGAENWKNIYQWSSDNEAVATVDTAGIVTAVAEGEANITITVGDYVGTVKVTVGEPKVELAYEAVQVNHNTVDFVFNKNVEYTAGDVTLTKMYGDYPINWPVSTFACKDNKVTISTYVDFEDGDKYIVKIGAEDEGTEFTTTIGAVDEIKVTWKSTGKAKEEDMVAYAPLDEDDAEIPVYLSYKLFANGVDVTNAKKYKDGEIAFTVDETVTPFKDKVDIDEIDGKPVLYFEDISASFAYIIPTFTYEGAEDDVTFPGNSEMIVASPAPAYGISSVAAWSIVKEGDEKITWYGVNDDKGFRLFDDVDKDHTLVALVQDTLGKYYVFPSEAVSDMKAADYKYNGNDVLLFSKIDETDEDAENYRLEFKSTNDNTLFVGDKDGSITSIVDKKTSVLVSLYDENEDGEEYLVRHLAVVDVDIDEQRKISDVKVTVGFNELPSDGDFTTGKVTFKVVDQDGQPIKANGLEIKTSVDKKDFNETELFATPVDGKVGEFEVTVDGSKYTYTKSNDKEDILSSVKYTVKVKDTNVKDDFTVKVAEPEYKTVDGVEVIEVEEYKADAANMNQTISKTDDLKNFKQTITVYEYSNDLKVGVKDDKITLLTKGNPLLDKDSKNLEVLSSEAEEGDVFVVVYDPNGVAVGDNMIKEVSAGKYEFTVGATEKKTVTASGSPIDVTKYEATGDYIVKVYTITREYNNDKASKAAVEATKFTVSRNNPVVQLKKQDVVDLTGEGTIDLDTLVREAFSFKFGSDDLKEDKGVKFVIADGDYKYNEDAGRVYIYRVQVYVTLNNNGDATYFDAGKVTVNKYVEVDSLAE